MRVSGEDSIQVPGARNTEANLLAKCKFCHSLGSVSLQAASGGEKGLFHLESRGLQPLHVRFEDGLQAEASFSSLWHQIDFQMTDEWCGYDEVSGEALEIYGLTVDFERF